MTKDWDDKKGVLILETDKISQVPSSKNPKSNLSTSATTVLRL